MKASEVFFFLADGRATAWLDNRNGADESVPLPDSMRASTLLEQIGKERSWTDDQIEQDVDILDRNRLYYVRDLRALSDHSWTVIELLPLVRDLLRTAVEPNWEKGYKEDKKMKKKMKKMMKAKYDGTEDGNGTSTIGEPVVPTADLTTKQQPSVFTGRPIKPVGHNKIHVRTAAGEIYECDRFCPHKGVDLASWGQVMGNSLICTKHNWEFSLQEGVVGPKGRTIHPCRVNDW
ncbi:hypothetical protein BX666DRAFT_397076 [Dichotomocladium elegans]|nr:hypothetical protein BX666DRAFT_397076 [Dichotomocladium elegans]